MSIHREALIEARPDQIFELLTDGAAFAAATGMPAELTDREGDAFTLFGGRIEGRQVELVRGRRVVQAWRLGGAHDSPWDPGVFSVVRFTLQPEAAGTRLVIDHDGIPAEWADHVAGGYPAFYEEPIRRYFGQRDAAD